MTNHTDIKELTHEQMVSWLHDHKVASYRATQVLKWIYLRQTDCFDEMTDLGKALRDLLKSHFAIQRLETARVETSKQDGSKKYLFKLRDGEHIESVLIPEKGHHTFCISSQVGCALGCKFCLTAKLGFIRNLTSGEIIDQVRDMKKDIGDSGGPINIVFMGMGEPLLNYENVINALSTITDAEYGLRISNRRVTISTAGIVPRLLDLGQDSNANLAVSLNATDNQTRSQLMPVNRKYPLEDLIDICKRYSLAPRQRITFEYILIKGVNDSLDHARQLATLLRPVRAKINLIPFNEHEESSFRRPGETVVQEFREILVRRNYTVITRHSKGQDISAACGQLRANLASHHSDSDGPEMLPRPVRIGKSEPPK